MSSTAAGTTGPGGGSLVSDELTDDGASALPPIDSDSQSIENELIYTEEEDNGLLENNTGEASGEEEEHSSESSVSNTGMKKKLRNPSGQGDRDEKDGSVTIARRRQRTVSSSGGLLGSTRRREPILRTLTRTIYTAG